MCRFHGNPNFLLTIIYVINTCTYIQCQSNSTTVATTSEVSSNNVLWMVVGVVCGVVVVILTVICGCVAFHFHKSKRVHPQSDTETICSESESYSRPTTASHIHFEPEEEAMSKPVPMTPFELRKLYVETFPYSKWKKGFDGHLRPHMGLKFVDPRIYARTKTAERSFKQQIYSFEMSDSLTVRSNTVSRLTRPVITAMSNLETLQENPSNESEGGTGVEPSRTRDHVMSARSAHSDVKRNVLQGDDVEL